MPLMTQTSFFVLPNDRSFRQGNPTETIQDLETECFFKSRSPVSYLDTVQLFAPLLRPAHYCNELPLILQHTTMTRPEGWPGWLALGKKVWAHLWIARVSAFGIREGGLQLGWNVFKIFAMEKMWTKICEKDCRWGLLGSDSINSSPKNRRLI